jgi:hypothetical protein
VPSAEIYAAKNRLIIANKTVTYYSEGDEYSFVVDARLNFEEGAHQNSEFTMNLAYSTDKGYFRSQQLN